MERGTVVRATAGRDSGGLFVVAGVLDDSILIVDGKRRPLERPKHKNPKHLAEVGKVLSEDEMRSNKMIRRTLRALPGQAAEHEVGCAQTAHPNEWRLAAKEEIPCQNRTL